MALLTADRLLIQYGTPDAQIGPTQNQPVATGTTIYGGAMVGLDGSGNAIPANGVTTCISVIGTAYAQVVNTAVSGVTGSGTPVSGLFVEVVPGCFLMNNSSSTNAVTQAYVNLPVYAVDDNTVSNNSNSSVYPIAGRCIGIQSDSSQPGYNGVWVQLGSLHWG